MTDHADPDERASKLPPPLIAVAGWVVPGAGYWLIGERARGVVVLVAILTMFLSGMLIAGVRVIDVPGYGVHGYKRQVVARRGYAGYVIVDPKSPEEEADPARDAPDAVPLGWALSQRTLAEIANKPWFAGQVLAGPVCLISASLSNRAARAGVPRSHAPLENIGTLYTAVAGMLNLFIVIDSTYRAGLPRPRPQPESAAGARLEPA
jgi:hypothetical protein